MLQNRPIALTLIAAALMLGGVQAILEIIGAFSFGRLNVNLSFLLLPAGIGLLRLSDAWRKFSLFCLGLAALVVVGLVIYEAVKPGSMPVTWFGVETHGAPRYLLFTFLVAVCGYLLFWAMRTLTRKEITLLFRKGTDQPPEPTTQTERGPL